MKIIIFLAFLLGTAAALEPAWFEKRAVSPRKRTSRPNKVAAAAMRAPEYTVSTGTPTELRSKFALTRAPGLQQRSGLVDANKLVSRQDPKASDFFECTNPVRLTPLRILTSQPHLSPAIRANRSQKPSPSAADCRVVVNQVLSTDDEIIIAPNSCLVFTFRTCQAFFCSLCEILDTSTQFIGSELDTIEALCVENGQAGTIVGEDAPQWDAGFTYAGQGLPTFDVC